LALGNSVGLVYEKHDISDVCTVTCGYRYEKLHYYRFDAAMMAGYNATKTKKGQLSRGKQNGGLR